MNVRRTTTSRRPVALSNNTDFVSLASERHFLLAQHSTQFNASGTISLYSIVALRIH